MNGPARGRPKDKLLRRIVLAQIRRNVPTLIQRVLQDVVAS
jgi:hypothetical protein